MITFSRSEVEPAPLFDANTILDNSEVLLGAASTTTTLIAAPVT